MEPQLYAKTTWHLGDVSAEVPLAGGIARDGALVEDGNLRVRGVLNHKACARHHQPYACNAMPPWKLATANYKAHQEL